MHVDIIPGNSFLFLDAEAVEDELFRVVRDHCYVFREDDFLVVDILDELVLVGGEPRGSSE